MKYVLNPLAIYELGQRSNQEDSIFPVSGEVTAEDRLFIVCDGMGGHESGEVASQTVCQTMSEYILSQTSPEGAFTDEQFNEALNAAYDSLDQKDNGAAKKMGTTMTLLKFHSGGCLLAHIGDSRIYHIRPSERYIFHTRDHSLINDLYDIGEITLEEMKSAEYADKIAYATVDGNIPYFWRISQPSDFVTSGGAAGYTKGDTWLISNSILLNGSCDPDAGVAIKNISQSLEIYSHTYEEAGTYTATFVANNANYVHQGGQVVRELTINVVE